MGTQNFVTKTKSNRNFFYILFVSIPRLIQSIVIQQTRKEKKLNEKLNIFMNENWPHIQIDAK